MPDLIHGYPGRVSSAESDRPEAPSGPGTPGGTPSGRPDPPVAARTDRPEQPAVPLLIYTALRVGLVAALTAVLAMFMPLMTFTRTAMPGQ